MEKQKSSLDLFCRVHKNIKEIPLKYITVFSLENGDKGYKSYGCAKCFFHDQQKEIKNCIFSGETCNFMYKGIQEIQNCQLKQLLIALNFNQADCQQITDELKFKSYLIEEKILNDFTNVYKMISRDQCIELYNYCYSEINPVVKNEKLDKENENLKQFKDETLQQIGQLQQGIFVNKYKLEDFMKKYSELKIKSKEILSQIEKRQKENNKKIEESNLINQISYYLQTKQEQLKQTDQEIISDMLNSLQEDIIQASKKKLEEAQVNLVNQFSQIKQISQGYLHELSQLRTKFDNSQQINQNGKSLSFDFNPSLESQPGKKAPQQAQQQKQEQKERDPTLLRFRVDLNNKQLFEKIDKSLKQQTSYQQVKQIYELLSNTYALQDFVQHEGLLMKVDDDFYKELNIFKSQIKFKPKESEQIIFRWGRQYEVQKIYIKENETDLKQFLDFNIMLNKEKLFLQDRLFYTDGYMFKKKHRFPYVQKMIWGPEVFGELYRLLENEDLIFLQKQDNFEKEYEKLLEEEIMVPLDLMLERYRNYFPQDSEYNWRQMEKMGTHIFVIPMKANLFLIELKKDINSSNDWELNYICNQYNEDIQIELQKNSSLTIFFTKFIQKFYNDKKLFITKKKFDNRVANNLEISVQSSQTNTISNLTEKNNNNNLLNQYIFTAYYLEVLVQKPEHDLSKDTNLNLKEWSKSFDQTISTLIPKQNPQGKFIDNQLPIEMVLSEEKYNQISSYYKEQLK